MMRNKVVAIIEEYAQASHITGTSFHCHLPLSLSQELCNVNSCEMFMFMFITRINERTIEFNRLFLIIIDNQSYH